MSRRDIILGAMIALITALLSISATINLTKQYQIQNEPELNFFIDEKDLILHRRNFEIDEFESISIYPYNIGKIPIYHAYIDALDGAEYNDGFYTNILNFHGLIFSEVPIGKELIIKHPNLTTISDGIHTINLTLRCLNCNPKITYEEIEFCLADRNVTFCDEWVKEKIKESAEVF